MTEYDERIIKFLEQLEKSGVQKIIAFSGSLPSVPTEFLEAEREKRKKDLEAHAEEVVEQSFEVFQGLPIAILTGGTDFDIQKYAAERAKRHGMPLIGVYPQRGAKYRIKSLDLALEVAPKYGSSEWCDETEIFAKLPHGVELIGGGMGSAAEFALIMKMNERKVKDKQDPIYVAAVACMGHDKACFSDLVFTFPMKEDVRTACLPSYRISRGDVAARFLVDKLKLRK